MAVEPDPGIEVHTANKGANFTLSGSWSGRFVTARSNITEIPKNRESSSDQAACALSGTMTLVSHAK